MSTAPHAELGVQLAVNRARAAAREGDLERAARLLDEVGSFSVAVLDLRARVHAQRGELAEADRCWAQVQERVPDNPDAARGRRAVAGFGGRAGLRPTVAVVAALAGVAVLGGGAWLGLGGGQPVPDGLEQQTARVEELQQRLAAMEAQREAAAAQVAAGLDAIERELAMPGVAVHRRADDVQLVFEAGLFPRGTEISPDGEALLAEVGRRLSGLRATTTVVGHTAAVPGGPTSGGSMTGLARAQAAAARLAAGGGQPLTAFTLASADQSAAPFPDAARSRTVTLEITPW